MRETGRVRYGVEGDREEGRDKKENIRVSYDGFDGELIFPQPF